MKPLNILLAEDNAGDVLLVRQALMQHGIDHQLYVVEDGEQAIDFVAQMGIPGQPPCPDLVLLDVNLPKADGAEILNEIRKHPECAATPVVVVTSSDARKDREQMAGLGISHYFCKPSDLEEFMRLGAVVRQVLETETLVSNDSAYNDDGTDVKMVRPQPQHERSGGSLASSAEAGVEGDLRMPLGFAECIVDTVREPLLVLDGNLHVRIASRSFYETFGVSPEETIGRFVYHLGDGQWDIPALRTLLEEVLPKEKALRDFEVVHEFPLLGRRVMLLNAGKLWREGNNTQHLLLAIEDVTERKRIAEELVRSNEDLQRFAYVAAHDLRSPLNAGLNLLELLARRTKATLNEQDARTLELAISNFQRLGALMQDILSYSEIGNAPQQRAVIMLREPLDVAIANLQHHIEHCGATITAGNLPEVHADRTQMVMVFQNLIGNALKYRRDQPPTIRIEADREENNWRVSVADNGQGFEQKHAASIFEPFRRLHGKGVPGSGIGLATCKRIIERQGGRIWAESELGHGSKFHFTVPEAG